NKEAYVETCSSIGMVLWNHRMNMLYGDAKYANVIERTLYNALLAGESLDGRKFFYTNVLESDGNRHRGEKYGIACCPSNMARFIPSVGSYIYSEKGNELLVNLFIGSETKLSLNNTPATITQKTEYPFDGKVTISVDPSVAVDGKIKIRIPDWCKSYTATLNGKNVKSSTLDNGYLTLNKKWNKGDVIALNFDMPVNVVESDPNVVTNAGRRAIQRGPIVYCVEQVDNKGIDLNNLELSSKNKFTVINGDGILAGTKKLQTTVGKNKITFVPYYAWENRESGKMLVWVKYSK
ncbi:MAG: glycoside hydrolase family 127 protein, partial [Chitinophagaceae bacterium]|nr:glycoside hydrolase family 127 protein [Chitinophagaceae bacterium]